MALNTDSTNFLTVRRLWSIMSSFKDKIVTALGKKSDKSSTVSNVAWSSSKLTKTINGTTTDVVSASTLKSAMSLNNVTNDAQVKRSEMGTANGVATLDANGIINTSQLPSYVDDVLEYSAKSQFPATGETGKIYVDTSTNLSWRWGGTTYVEISPSLALGETSSTAYRGDRGKTAYDHSQLTSGNPHNVTAADVKAVRYDTNAQGLTDTQKSNARTNIGAGTSNLTIGTTSSTASAGNHSHGNITNGGALQTTDVTIANGDKLVVTDASDSNKVARTGIAFDGSTKSKVLTQKGTFETVSSLVTDRYYVSSTMVSSTPLPDYRESGYYKLYQTEYPDFCVWVILYDVTEFFDGTISNVSTENSSFFGEISAMRLAGIPSVGYAKVAASISYNTSTILKTDSDTCVPVVAKCDIDYIQTWSSSTTEGIYIGDVGSTVDISNPVTSSGTKYCIIDCSDYSTLYVNAGWYAGSWSTPKTKIGAVWAFIDSSNKVISKSSTYGSSETLSVPSNAVKFVCNTDNAKASQSYIGIPSATPKYYLALDIRYGAGTLDLFGRFYTRTTATSSYAARPLLLTKVANVGQNSSSTAPAGWSQYRRGVHNTNALTTDTLLTARKLAVSLSNTSTDTSFDGSEDITNIKTTGTLGVANGGTGQTNATAAQYALLNPKCSELTSALEDNYRFMFASTDPSTSVGVFVGYRKASSVWNYIKGKISSALGLSESGYTGNAATASAAQSGSALETAINGKQDALAAQTAYSAKGSATKVPQITTNALGQVTGITEVTISGVTPASHAHGNITNAGGITASGVTIANGDSLVIVDSSETNKLIKQTSITFDGSTTTKALTQKGTFETFQTAITYMTADQETAIVTELGDL